MPRVLIVCTGNLCRSPMATGLLKARLARDPARRHWRVASAGTWAREGEPASTHAIEEMSQRQIDLSAHRARPVTGKLVSEADLVLVMTRNHAEALKTAFPSQADRIVMLSETTGQVYDIRDPYGGSRQEYACTAKELENLIEIGYARITHLVETAPAGSCG